MAKLTTKFKSLKKTTKVDFATYLQVKSLSLVSGAFAQST